LNGTLKRLLALILGLFGLRAWLRHRAQAAAATPGADDLRAKLAETKVAEPEPAAPSTVEERRADVHSRAREAMDELRQDGSE
jgi:hypothetical protein